MYLKHLLRLTLSGILCSLLTLLSSADLRAQCEVDAGDDLTVCEGENIVLGGAPTVVNANPGYTISWDNGAGNDENPSLTATNTTTYTVTLTDGGCTDTDQVTVTVLPIPDVAFVFGPNNDCAGVPVNFVNNTSDCINCEYSWDFGNPASGANNTSTTANPNHDFVAVGNGVETFDVTLTATAENGCSASFTDQVTINQAPEAVLTEAANFTQCLGINDFFAYVTDASSPGTNSNYFIDWGDGSPVYDSPTAPNNLEHIYSGIDIWELTYTVTGTNGCETTETYAVTNITNPAVGAATLGNTLQCGPVDLCFDLNSYENNHPSTEYFVTFGDGSPQETFAHPPPVEVCHEYSTSSCENDPPFYTFTITADNNCTPSTVTISPIQIYTPPIASFTAPANNCVNTAVPFDNTSIGGYNQGCSPNASWSWDFGDPASGANNTSTAENPSHVYSAPGTYTVTLVATNAGNPALACGDTEFQLDICVETPPTPAFSLSDTEGCLPLASDVTNTSDDGIPCAVNSNWEVFYADLTCAPNSGAFSYTGGTDAGSLEPSFSFQSVGIYDVVLEMTNSCGIFTDTETVEVYTVPEISLNPLNDICEGSSVSPTANVLDCGSPATTYAWDFDGGNPGTSASLSPGAVTFDNAENYDIDFSATNICGTSTATTPLTVEASPVINIMASPDDEICSGEQVSLNASGTAVVSYTWTNAPGLNSTIGPNVTANPLSDQTYTVTGTTSAGCPGTGSIDITVNPIPVVQQPPVDYEICEGESILITVDVSNGSGSYTNYAWSPAGTLDDSGTANPIASPLVDTTYEVEVTDSEGCIGLGDVFVDVNPLPVVDAGPDAQYCNEPVPELLTGYSPTSGGTGEWSGSGITDPIAGEFTPPGVGNYTLEYTFTDSNGCVNSDFVDVEVVAPTQADAGPDLEFCESATIEQLDGVGVWSGSNVTPDGQFTPSPAGTYTLDYSEGVGSCLSSDQLTITVHENPTVTADPQASICAGDSIQLGAAVNGGTLPFAIEEWEADPSLSDPTDATTFASPQSNTIYTFNVEDDNGCTATDSQEILVESSPTVEAGSDLTLCDQPFDETLSGFSPTSGGTGEWTGPNITDPAGVFTPNGEGVFTVFYTFTNTAGCEATDSVEVTVTGLTTADAGPDFSLCLNDPIEQLAQPGTWMGDNVSADGQFSPVEVGDFTLTLTIGVGTCESTDEVEITVNDLPSADAGPDLAICDSDAVQLQGSADSPNLPIVTYDWNNGPDLSDNDIQDPLASPSAETTYTLTVTDDAGCSASDEVTVFVNALPLVDAGDPITLCDQPIAEELTSNSPADGDGGTGEWTGPGITDPSGSFESPGVGNYFVFYTFTDDLGCSNVDSLEIEVIAPEVADAGADLAICPNEGDLELQGFSPATGGNWFGSGVIDAESGIIDPSIVDEGLNTLYYEIGSGTCYSLDSLVLEVLPLPVLDPGADLDICANLEPIEFDDFDPLGGTWEGDGIIDANGTFDPLIGEGTYNPIYFFTGLITGCTDTVQRTIEVHPVPEAITIIDPEACTNGNLDIENNSTGATSYLWDFGNSETSDFVVPAYTYPDSGNYTIELVAYNDFLCSDTTTVDVEAINPPEAAIGLSTDEGCAPLEVEFSNESVGQYLDYDWDLNIAQTTNEEPGSLTYEQGDEVAIYPISLSATNYCGADIAIDTISVLPQPVAGFGTDLDVGCSPFTVTFNNISTGLPDTFDWDFGNGNSSGVEEPGTQVYFTDTIAQDYTITLNLENECGVDSAEYIITVLPNTVTAFFNTDVTIGCSPLDVEFTDFSEGGTVITYDFGNNDITDEPNPTYTFDEAGMYTIFQYVNNGCSFDTTFVEIEVLPGPNLDFSIEQPSACEETPVQFQNESSGASDVSWDFGDGNISDEANPEHTYLEEGTYTVTLFGTSTLNECEGQVQQEFEVISAPDASIASPGDVGCSPFSVQFDNLSTGANFYSWEFGDGNSSAEAEPEHTFVNDTGDPLIYTVSLITENLQLCVDTATIDIIVSPTPVADFDLPFNETCEQEIDVNLVNTTTFANNYEWELDGQLFSDLFEPGFGVSGPGTYTVSLWATNSYGCEDETEQDITIYALPDVDFSANITEGCQPLEVQFINGSAPGQSYQWDFGIGGDSEEESPATTFPAFGDFDVSLAVSSADGCTNELTLEDYITVHPLPFADFSFTPEEGSLFDPVISFTNLSFGYEQSIWFFGDGNASTETNPVHGFERAGELEVQLEVVTEVGCSDTKIDYITIKEENEVFVPNAFTPDNDGINDDFKPVLVGSNLVYYEFQIFDRWGEKIFETNNPEEPWIGNYKGGDHYVKDDVYVWQLRVEWASSSRVQQYTGKVTMIK